MVADSMIYGPLTYTVLSTGGVTDGYDTGSDNATIISPTSSITKPYVKQYQQVARHYANSTAICGKWHKYSTTCSSYEDDWSGTSYLQWRRVGRNDDTYWCTYDWPDINRKKPPSHRLREIIQARIGPVIISTRKPMPEPDDVREIRARETLHRVLGDQKFRTFLRKGFISVRGKSGLVYQIFPGHGVTNVFRDGEKIERLCVVLRGNFPPTDSLIMRYLLILNDENKFRGYAIKHSINQPTELVVDERSLVEIFKELKRDQKPKKALKLVA